MMLLGLGVDAWITLMTAVAIMAALLFTFVSPDNSVFCIYDKMDKRRFKTAHVCFGSDLIEKRLFCFARSRRHTIKDGV